MAESFKSTGTGSGSSGKEQAINRPSNAGSALPSPNPSSTHSVSSNKLHRTASIPAIVEPLYQVKLLQALRSGDPALIHPFLAEIVKDKRSSTSAVGTPIAAENDRANGAAVNTIDTGAAALHLAIRCASAPTISLLLSHRSISPNGIHPPGSGTTALHLAASAGRVDVVNLLLEQEGIDDTLRDKQGKTALEVAVGLGLADKGGAAGTMGKKGRDIVKAIRDSHAFLNASYRSLLRSYILSTNGGPSPALLALLASPRSLHIDLSYLATTTASAAGLSLLHAAAVKGDLRLIELAVRAGADVWVRDTRGRVPGDWDRTGKKDKDTAAGDERVRVFLRQFASQDPSLLSSPSLSGPSNGSTAVITEPPVLRGYLSKYTNVAKGYDTRWFVLKGGILSYYRRQSDESISSRGSISMRTALIKCSSSDRCRFEVSSHSSSPGHGYTQQKTLQKWYMKANHPVEAARWTAALGRSVEWARSTSEGHGVISAGGISVTVSTSSSPVIPTTTAAGRIEEKKARRKSGESDRSSVVRSVKSAGAHAHRLSGTLLRKAGAASGRSISTNAGGRDSPLEWNGSRVGDSDGEVHVTEDRDGDGDDDDDAELDDDDDDFGAGDSSSNGEGGSGNVPPYEASFELHGNTLITQAELSSQLLSAPTSMASGPRDFELKSALRDSFALLQGLAHEYIQMSREREAWYSRQLERERRRQTVWEESLATVVREGETLEQELRVRSRKRGSRFFDASFDGLGTGSTIKGRRGSMIIGVPPKLREEIFEDAREQREAPPMPKRSDTQETVTTTTASMTTSATKPPSRVPTLNNLPSRPTLSSSKFLSTSADDADEEGDTTDEEDEFFDAIESGTLPNLVIPEALSISYPPGYRHSAAPPTGTLFPGTSDVRPYECYRELRTDLGLNEERPRTSLWSVLKGSIGKDLTKISFPVYFNEPTSMLQRMAEDMEFSECLDAAVRETDPLRRLAFVSAFAMSNYSSTIGRIAKPFNPMLSETFEYVRLDKEYRYFSEQVSHHPPISACWAESPAWSYYGEVDAQNKFMGKSFEIRPTGIAHADLVLPSIHAPPGTSYPEAPVAKYGRGRVVEHYSWKKVTTNVSGFILGSPTIDHYGDMVVTNHRTNDQCILTFKPRGWRGKDAYEIAGEVVDASGTSVYQIAGRWNSQLIARPITNTTDTTVTLNPDLDVSGNISQSPISPAPAPSAPFVLWRNTLKPEGSPFNLTPFALTLNSTGTPPTSLVPFLPPTDCRLRPDQRSFEQGLWDLANELKQAQEEKQRSIRKAREEGRTPPHQPRWFTREREKDTEVGVWMPRLVRGETKDEHERVEYWVERERVWKEGGKGKAKWTEVEEIFIEAPDGIKI